jgi:membrane protease YdiL (CAAX protease family)
VSEPEHPGLGFAASLFLHAAPFLRLALRFASGLVPGRPRPAHRWNGAEVLAVCLAPFVLFTLLAALLGQQGIFASLILNELVFGLTGALALALAVPRAQGLASLGLAAPVPRRAFLAAPLVYVPWFFVALALGSAWARLCRARGWEEEQETLLQVMSLQGPELLVALAIAILLGPLLEELLFRGFLQSALAQSLGERGALVASSAVFAALHGVAGLPVLFLLSLFLGWLQLRTRCLWVPWSAHALNNAVTLGLALALKDHAG